LVIIGLVVTAVLDLQVGDSTASVVAAVAAVVGLAISVVTLILNSAKRSANPARVRSRGRGAIAAGGSIRGNAIGKDAKVTGPVSSAPPPPAPRRGDVSARGTGAMGAGGDIADNAIGEGSER
jgi:hypothetical protein